MQNKAQIGREITIQMHKSSRFDLGHTNIVPAVK